LTKINIKLSKSKAGSEIVLPFFYLFFKLHETAEPVEKIQMANSDNFCSVKNQQLTGHRKPQNAQI